MLNKNLKLNITYMDNKKKVGLVVGILGIIVVAFLAFDIQLKPKISLGLAPAEFIDNGSDVIGSKSATTTVGVNTGAGVSTVGGVQVTATTSYPVKIGGNINQATFTVQAKQASSTSRLNIEIQGSQDYGCETIATSTTDTSQGDVPLIGEINWFDAGDHFRGKAQTTTFTNVSSTNFITWSNPESGAGKEIILENLDYECLRFNIAGVSTTVWVQISTK